MNDNTGDVNYIHNRLYSLVDEYDSNKEDRYDIIVEFRELIEKVEYHYDNSSYGNSASYLNMASQLWDYCNWFSYIIIGDHPNQISLKSSGDIIGNIIEYYEKIHGRDDIINNILNE